MTGWMCLYGIMFLLTFATNVSGVTVVEGVVGDPITLACTLKPDGDLEWTKGGNTILIKSTQGDTFVPDGPWKGDVSLTGSSDLKILSLRRGRDNGTGLNGFSCYYTYSKFKQEVQINLLARITGVEILGASNGEVTVTEATRSFTSSVSGNPTLPIFYTWKVGGKTYFGKGNLTGILKLSPSKTSSSIVLSVYNQFSNGTELSSQEVRVQLIHLSKITGVQIPEAVNGSVTLTLGSSKNLTCSVSGDSTNTIHYMWEVDGRRVHGEDSMTFSLIANKTTKTVSCTASNKYSNGTDYSSQDVTVTLNVILYDNNTAGDVSGPAGGIAGGVIAALVAAFVIVAIIVWRKRKKGSKPPDTPGTCTTENLQENGVTRKPGEDSVYVYDNLNTCPDYENNLHERTYAKLNQGEMAKTDTQSVSINPVRIDDQEDNTAQYEDLVMSNGTNP